MSTNTTEHREGELVEGELPGEPITTRDGYREEAERYMMTYRPKEYRRLRTSGRLEETLDRRMMQYDRHLQRLVSAGYQHHEMMKILLPLYVYPAPEAGDGRPVSVLNEASAGNIDRNKGAQDENKVCCNQRGQQDRLRRRPIAVV
ncbi:MAG: hypothetical protein FWB85_03415 [Chitinispirillia bacterium]|nr:hypothetical protein [Chitinispirillia bacterium]MCL2241472.1 hypothetical protein [Chitinispirillia bacterium]